MLEKTGKWYLIGIVSAGYSCAQPGQPGIYHRVAKTVDWITYVINSQHKKIKKFFRKSKQVFQMFDFGIDSPEKIM